ncbi:MAG TPA: response regulator [Pirellulales bacterium]|nr:response regulator [Pirellulales bacterium]
MVSATRDCHVLVIDDQTDSADTLARLLRAHHFAASTCTYSKDCMSRVESSHPDVILLDLAMPGMDGFNIADELRQNPDLRPKLLIAVTGLADEDDKQRTREAGFDFHLVKPVMWDQLEPLLVQATDERRGDLQH